jgi:hypothetical protein
LNPFDWIIKTRPPTVEIEIRLESCRFAAIRQISGGDWWHCLDSTWLIEHPGPATAIWQSLVSHIHNPTDKTIGDKLLVAQVVKNAQWTTSFPEACHNWLLTKLT